MVVHGRCNTVPYYLYLGLHYYFVCLEMKEFTLTGSCVQECTAVSLPKSGKLGNSTWNIVQLCKQSLNFLREKQKIPACLIKCGKLFVQTNFKVL